MGIPLWKETERPSIGPVRRRAPHFEFPSQAKLLACFRAKKKDFLLGSPFFRTERAPLRRATERPSIGPVRRRAPHFESLTQAKLLACFRAKKKDFLLGSPFFRTERDSNPQPLGPKPSALSIELSVQEIAKAMSRLENEDGQLSAKQT
jgi:hypothetical protein